jgi:hypothetical protein
MRSQNVALPPDPAAVMDGFDGILIAAGLIEMKEVKDPATGLMTEVPATDEQGDPIASRLAFRNRLIHKNLVALPPAVGDQRSEKGSYHNLLIATVNGLPFDHATTTDPVEKQIYLDLIELTKQYCATGSTATAQQAVNALGGDKVLLKSGRKKGSKIIGSAGPVDGVWISNSHDPNGDRMDTVKAKINTYSKSFAGNVAPWINLNTQDPAMAAEALSLVTGMEAELILAVSKVKNDLTARAALAPAPTPPAAITPVADKADSAKAAV